jgi:hypothetical protein
MSNTTTKLALRWILANTAAWCIAGGLGLPLFSAVTPRLVCGAMVGAAQWLALRGLGLSPLWIATTCLAWVTGQWFGLVPFGAPDPYWGGGVGGALAGIVQARAFGSRHRGSALWIPTTILASILGWYGGIRIAVRFNGDWAFWAGGATAGVLMGAISAPVLWWMVRKPHSG